MRIPQFNALPNPLSGYKAGSLRGGKCVQELEETFAGLFGVKHAIACNSATSGLLAAARACQPITTHQDIAVPCFTMSATAAAARFACPTNHLYFMDCDKESYCSEPIHCPETHIGLIIVTNLFGGAAYLTGWRELADKLNCCLIEDNAQSPFAMTADSKLAGTVGDVGVFSFNVHKHFQCGEGGMMVTNSPEISAKLRGLVNHGEVKGQDTCLNLRMTEICAMQVLDQLDMKDEIIGSRMEIGKALTEQVNGLPGFYPPIENGVHVYYCWALRVDDADKVLGMMPEGHPFRKGYVDPLYRLPAFSYFAPDFSYECGVAESLHDKHLILYENCAQTPTKAQIKGYGDEFKRIADILSKE